MKKIFILAMIALGLIALLFAMGFFYDFRGKNTPEVPQLPKIEAPEVPASLEIGSWTPEGVEENVEEEIEEEIVPDGKGPR